eukprot:6446496-Amphidinium_carterae.1
MEGLTWWELDHFLKLCVVFLSRLSRSVRLSTPSFSGPGTTCCERVRSTSSCGGAALRGSLDPAAVSTGWFHQPRQELRAGRRTLQELWA